MFSRTLFATWMMMTAACGGDGSGALFPDAPTAKPDAAQPPDPDGQYQLTVTWTGGNCPSTPAYSDSFAVSMGANGHVFTPATAEHITGTSSCQTTSCALYVDEWWSSTDPPQELKSTLTLTNDGRITGHSTLTIAASTSVPSGCTETADATGTRSH